MTRSLLLAAALLGLSVAARGDEVLQQAMEARSAGAYGRAIELLRAAEAAGPALSTELLLAETLAWNKQFQESAELYEAIRSRHLQSREALAGLARVRLWQGKYREARRLYSRLLEGNESDRQALEGLATAAYWSGDFRTAEREFRRLDTDFARRSLAEIRATSRPSTEFEVEDTHDDQPFHATRTAIRGLWFTDPLTRWNASAGSYRLSSAAGGSHTAPFLIAGSQAVLPKLRLTLSASIGGIRTPDDRNHAIGGAAARLQLRPHQSLLLSVEEREIVTNATRLYPFVRTISFAWQMEGDRYASLRAERLRYSDRNSGVAADGYVLVPLFARGRWTVRAGASAAYRDTREARFYINGISSALDNSTGQFHYAYRGAYNPYWTPDDLVEGRLILGVEMRLPHSTVVTLQGDAGRARDKALGFWPQSGTTPFPLLTGSSRFERSFDPRRMRLTADTPLGGGLSLHIGFEHTITAYYEANSFHATVGRRL